MNVCNVCNEKLNLTRVEINRLKQLIAQKRADKFFLSDEDTNKVIHEFHTKKGQ
jgi:hypothetical protein